MFKIPAWEDDVPKIDSSFLQKSKKKESNVIKSVTKELKVNNVKEKNNNSTENGFNKATKNGIKNVTKKFNNNLSKKGNKNFTENVNNNITQNGINKQTRKRKLENKTPNSQKEKPINTKKKKSIQIDNIPETQNFDEILLNAKKKKFNEVIEKDDKEDLLFSENKKKGNKKKKKGAININENNDTIDKLVAKKNKKASKVAEEPVNSKKARLKLLLENKSNRSHINVSQTGNKLRDRMLERLKAAQFRYLNEKLYTSSGSEAQQLFQNDPSAFETYHQGYQLQVKKWPVNPLDVIVKKIMKMPKTHLIADMGCGEAALSRRIPHKVRSFDLVATAPGVEACDMARTPLLTASMDVVVYCLALMGTDLTQYLVEANRVLKMGGHLLIAEVESRFDKVEDFTKEVERLGFKLKQLDKSNNVFFFMEFTKIRDPPVKKAKLPVLTLKPCLYKRR